MGKARGGRLLAGGQRPRALDCCDLCARRLAAVGWRSRGLPSHPPHLRAMSSLCAGSVQWELGRSRASRRPASRSSRSAAPAGPVPLLILLLVPGRAGVVVVLLAPGDTRGSRSGGEPVENHTSHLRGRWLGRTCDACCDLGRSHLYSGCDVSRDVGRAEGGSTLRRRGGAGAMGAVVRSLGAVDRRSGGAHERLDRGRACAHDPYRIHDRLLAVGLVADRGVAQVDGRPTTGRHVPPRGEAERPRRNRHAEEAWALRENRVAVGVGSFGVHGGALCGGRRVDASGSWGRALRLAGSVGPAPERSPVRALCRRPSERMTDGGVIGHRSTCGRGG